MSSTTDQRQAAEAKIAQLIGVLIAHPGSATSTVVEECEALARAVGAFHMEAIRFRMFNVDRLLPKTGAAALPQAAALLEEVRRHLEAAGFYTRSHQAPG